MTLYRVAHESKIIEASRSPRPKNGKEVVAIVSALLDEQNIDFSKQLRRP